MWVRTFLLMMSAAVLSACFPATELSESNAETVLASTNSLAQISSLSAEGFRDSTVRNTQLKQIMAKTTNNLMGSCHEDQGSYLLSASEISQQFSLVFDRCAEIGGGEIDGALSGDYDATEHHYELSMAGQFTASHGSESITFETVQIDLSFTLNTQAPSLYVSHQGRYLFDTRAFKGTLTAQTLEPVGMDLTTLEVFGHVVYTDDEGNRLDVEHDNNGVHLSLNANLIKSYSHQTWSSRAF